MPQPHPRDSDDGGRRRFAGIKEVAARAGVSTSTASRVLSGRGYSSAGSRSRVLKAAEELGYEPHIGASALKSQASQIVGVAIQDMSNPFYVDLVRGINEATHAASYVPLLFDSEESSEREAEILRVMLRVRVAGVIIAPSMTNLDLLRRVQEHDIPIVQVDREAPGLSLDSVLVDNFAGAYEATEHLLRLGHTRVGVIAGPPTLTTGRQRLLGFEQAMRDHGIELDPRYVKVSDYRAYTGAALARELIEEQPRPTAIFAHNNVLAERLLLALRDAGLRVPDDIAVVGFDDVGWARLVSPSLTVVRQPAYTIGRMAAEILLRRLAGNQDPPVQSLLKAELVLRGSCGAQAAADARPAHG
jgi:LacI family transcriptional regulator